MEAADIPKQMWALQKQREGESYELVELNVPQPIDDEVLIRVDAVSICGSDMGGYFIQ